MATSASCRGRKVQSQSFFHNIFTHTDQPVGVDRVLLPELMNAMLRICSGHRVRVAASQGRVWSIPGDERTLPDPDSQAALLFLALKINSPAQAAVFHLL